MNTKQEIWDMLANVPDPEIPVVSVVDLGMVRHVRVDAKTVEVEVSPTYTGCPATEVIEASILAKLEERGVQGARVTRVLSPPWTSDWISESGRRKLNDFGIVPPAGSSDKRKMLGKTEVRCPRCNTHRTSLVSEFGSTACKASWRCDECLEPFDYFKCI